MHIERIIFNQVRYELAKPSHPDLMETPKPTESLGFKAKKVHQDIFSVFEMISAYCSGFICYTVWNYVWSQFFDSGYKFRVIRPKVRIGVNPSPSLEFLRLQMRRGRLK